MSALTDPLFTTSAVADIFGDRARVQAMLDFEAALAKAQAGIGMIPPAAAEAIAQACRAEDFDLDALGQATALAGNPAIPLVKALRGRVAPDAAKWVHHGATSQDVIDTGLVLQARRALKAIGDDLDRIDTALDALAREHAGTVMTARTLLQHALPTTFGLKAAGWLASVRTARAALASAGAALAPQLGGAAGTLAAFDGQGLALSRALAAELDLDAAPPWHARRERVAMLGSALALLCGTLGKAALDLTLMMQTEAGEAFEPAAEGKGGSSAMPHKRNPVALVAASAAARRAPGLAATLLSAMAQEHERAAGAWHAEWETLPELFRVAAGSAARMAETFEGLELDPARMRANLDLTAGLAFAEAAAQALTGELGRTEAHERVRAASAEALKSGRHLRAVLEADPECARLIGDRMDTIFDPAARLKEVRGLIGALLEDETF